MCAFVVQLAGSPDYVRGIIGRALCILLKWHQYDSRWLCASECSSNYAFNNSINTCVNGEYKNASHLIIDVEKSEFAYAIHNKYKRESSKTFNSKGIAEDNEECTRGKELNFPVPVTIFVEEKQMETVNTDKAEDVKTSNHNNNNRHATNKSHNCCTTDAVESQKASQEENVIDKHDVQMKNVNTITTDKNMMLPSSDQREAVNTNTFSDKETLEGNKLNYINDNKEISASSKQKNEQYKVDDNSAIIVNTNTDASTHGQWPEKQNNLHISEVNNMKNHKVNFVNTTTNEVIKCDAEKAINNNNIGNQTTTTTTITETIHKKAPSEFAHSSELPSHMFVRVEVICDKCNSNDHHNDSDCNSTEDIHTKKEHHNKDSKESNTFLRHYNVIFYETSMKETLSTSTEIKRIPERPSTFSYNQQERMQRNDRQEQHVNGIYHVLCADMVDVVKSIWTELQKYKSCSAVIDYKRDRYMRSRWSRNAQVRYKEHNKKYIEQMIKHAVQLSVEYDDIISKRYSGSHRHGLPIYSCIAFDQNEYNKIKQIIPVEFLEGKQIQNEFHMTTKFFGGSRQRVGCDDPLLFVLLHRCLFKEISVEVEAIVCDRKGLALVVRNLHDNPIYNDYDRLYNIRAFTTNSNDMEMLSSEIEATPSVSSDTFSTEMEGKAIAEQRDGEQQSESNNAVESKTTTMCSPFCESFTHSCGGNGNTIKENNNNNNSVDDNITCIPFICGNATPHITIANAKGVPPVYSNKLCHNWKTKLNEIEKECKNNLQTQGIAEAAGVDTNINFQWCSNRWNALRCGPNALKIKKVNLVVKGKYTFREQNT